MTQLRTPVSAQNSHAEPTCPAWCIATHRDETTLHLQANTIVRNVWGRQIPISRYDDAGRAGVYVGEEEYSLDDARDLIAALTAAVELPSVPVLEVVL